MKKENSKLLTKTQKAELNALAAMSDDQINKTEMPEVRDWSGAQRGLFYRPIKKQLTLRIDADLIAWFKKHVAHGHGYQTSINHALREYVSQQEHSR
jgi:uncharacterized protein (DUF4415 family)